MKTSLLITATFSLLCVATPVLAVHKFDDLGSATSTQAFGDFAIFSKGGSKATANVTFTVDPKLRSVYANQIKRDTLASVRMWSNDREPSIKMDVYAAPTQHFQFIYDYMKQVMPASQLANGWLDEKLRRSKTESNGFYGGGAPGNAVNGNDVFMVYVPNKYPINDAHWNSLVSHEYVHVVQRSLFRGSMAPMQCWVREGQANYIGWNYSGRASTSSFASAWKAQIRDLEQAHTYSKTQKFSKAYWQQWFLKNEFQDVTKDCEPTDNYVVGALAFQYLYGTYGHAKVESFLRNLRDAVQPCGDGGPTFITSCIAARNAAFTSAFGVSLHSAYPKFAQHIVSELRWAYPTS
ncbi:MAG: hypothetical protein WCH94_02495 [Actinomycetota bacterium]